MMEDRICRIHISAKDFPLFRERDSSENLIFDIWYIEWFPDSENIKGGELEYGEWFIGFRSTWAIRTLSSLDYFLRSVTRYL